jgi:maltose O-acetyltransferase
MKFIAKNIPTGHRFRRKCLKMAGYEIGEQVYIGEDLIIIDEPDDLGMVKIGDRVTLADRVTLVISSYPNFSKIRPFVKNLHGQIEINDDAWLGTGCIIMPDIKIGKGAVVGAGAVVTKNVPDFTVVVGVPAKPIYKIKISKSKKVL